MRSKSIYRKFDDANKLLDTWKKDTHIIAPFRNGSLSKKNQRLADVNGRAAYE